ncbi:hypothetical protein [Microtetraspora niveoalba]|uniref:hypothetical protein n=1 Tax=Microtetraspora niveoalba TaxID=46175 RepID=UPI00082F6D75|nr:hypothetical protein [Microtetraspora niveoalba]
MFTTEHTEYLREQVKRAEEVAAGWRALLTYAQSNAAGPLFTGNPYPPSAPTAGDTRVYPTGQEDGRAAWTSRQEAHFQGFQAAHNTLCQDNTGPDKADVCVREVGHEGKHNDGNGRSWNGTVTGGQA